MSGPVALVAGRENVLQRDPSVATAQRLDIRDSLVDLGLSAIGFGHDAGDRAAMARDTDGLASLHLVEDLSQAGLGVGSLDIAHEIGRFDWSVQLV